MTQNSGRFHLPLTALLLFLLASPARSQPAEVSVVGITEHLDEYIPSGISLTDHTGKTVDLKQMITKPTVISFVYYRCPGICSPLMNGLADVIRETDLVLGKDYQVLTISFDSRENTELAQKKRDNYLKKISGKDPSGWIFLTGDSLNIAKATQSLGFGFKMVNGQFMHEGALMLISPEGKITRYLKGIDFMPFEFKLAVIEASEGKSAPTLIKVLKFCYSYDRKSERYSLDITRIGASLTLLFALTLLIWLLIRGRKRNKSIVNP
jgi:protein SCO1